MGRSKIVSKENAYIMVTVALFVLLLNYMLKGTIYIESPDGNLYLSVAKNFIKNGHFIQTDRWFEKDFVVPFGLPLIYTILCLLFSNIYAIVLIQYLIFGMSTCLVKCIVVSIFKKRYLGYVSIVLFLGSRHITDIANPAYLLTETYTLFLLLLWVFFFIQWIDSRTEKNVIALLAISFILFVIRPAFSAFLLFSFIFAIIDVVKRKMSLKAAGIVTGLFAFILAVNIGINYRETKTIVFWKTIRE